MTSDKFFCLQNYLWLFYLMPALCVLWVSVIDNVVCDFCGTKAVQTICKAYAVCSTWHDYYSVGKLVGRRLSQRFKRKSHWNEHEISQILTKISKLSFVHLLISFSISLQVSHERRERIESVRWKITARSVEIRVTRESDLETVWEKLCALFNLLDSRLHTRRERQY